VPDIGSLSESTAEGCESPIEDLDSRGEVLCRPPRRLIQKPSLPIQRLKTLNQAASALIQPLKSLNQVVKNLIQAAGQRSEKISHEN